MVLLDCGERHQLGDLYLLELAQGLEEALVARGLGPVINATRETLQDWVKAQTVDGVVLAVGAERQDLARQFAAVGTPCVVIEQVAPPVIPGVGWVFLDLESGAREAAAVLFELGHRRVGFIGNSEDDHVREAFFDELSTRGIRQDSDLTIIAGRGRAAGAAAARRLLEMPQRPTAIFARTDVLALGALDAARELFVRVPADLSVIGHDDISVAGALGLTTVRIDCRALGRAAADVLTCLQGEPASTPFPTIRTAIIHRTTVNRPALPAD